MKREMRGAEFVHCAGVCADLVADHAQPAFLVRRQAFLGEEPGLETRAQLRRLQLGDFRENHVAVFIDGDPFARCRVDMIVDIESQQKARRPGAFARYARDNSRPRLAPRHRRESRRRRQNQTS